MKPALPSCSAMSRSHHFFVRTQQARMISGKHHNMLARTRRHDGLLFNASTFQSGLFARGANWLASKNTEPAV